MSRYTIGDIEVSIAEPLPKEYDITYWESRCLAAEKYIEQCPCDPDITPEQIKAYKEWQQIKGNG